jgi:hypothetical protein
MFRRLSPSRLAGIADSAPLLYLAVIVLVCCAVVGLSDLLRWWRP